MKKYLELFFTMLKIGLFTFGGGYAMIALLQSELVAKRNWIDKDEFLDVVAIAESTPGPIAINAATYVGYKMLGVLGSLVATLAICIPSFTIIFLISLVFDAFLSLTVVEYAFRGIQIAVIYLILSAGVKMLRGMKKTALNIAITSSVTACMVIFSLLAVKFSTIYYIIICAAIGVFVYILRTLLSNRKGAEK